jgi:hypothetical protein
MTTKHCMVSFAPPGDFELIASDVEDGFDGKSDLEKVAPWRESYV